MTIQNAKARKYIQPTRSDVVCGEHISKSELVWYSCTLQQIAGAQSLGASDRVGRRERVSKRYIGVLQHKYNCVGRHTW